MIFGAALSKKAKSGKVFELNGISVEIGEAVSKDSGLLPATDEMRKATWFVDLLDELLVEMASSTEGTHGYKNRSKLEAGLLAIIAGLVMGRRSINAIANSFASDPLWTAIIGRFFNQKALSRLMEVLGNVGHGPLRRALLFSGSRCKD